MSFVNELKRRNVIRVGILYLVSAWLLLQLTDVLSSLLTVPQWAGSLVILLLALGFFPVMIFSWVYEMTPEGLKRETDVDRTQSVTAGTGRKINVLIVVLLALAIGAVITDRMIPETSLVVSDNAVGNMTASDSRSIAVLPFTDLSVNQDQQYFTDGLSEELLNLLVRVDELHVASRTSSFAYRNSTLGIPEISRALNVGHILEGSVRKDGDRIRITAQLIETSSDRHLWSENFDRDLVDIFAIQDEIANAIVQALTGEMGIGGDKAVTVETATDSIDAYAMYLAARELFIKRETIDESIRLFRAAIELDPEFARAWEGLAAAEVVGNSWIVGDGIDHDPRAKAAAEQALALNPDLSMPLAVLGLHATNAGTDTLGALDYYNSAIEKDAKNTSAWLWKGILLKEMGYMDGAIQSFEQCLANDPGYQNCRQHMAVAYLNKGDVTRAVALNNETLEHIFHSISAAFVSTYVRSGHRILAAHIADARLGHDGAPVMEWIRAVENPEADNSAGLVRLQDWAARTTIGITLHWVPHIFLAFNAYDELASDPEMSWLLWHPDAEGFRGTPHFKQYIRENGVLMFWREHGFPPQCRAIGDDDFECSGPG